MQREVWVRLIYECLRRAEAETGSQADRNELKTEKKDQNKKDSPTT